MNGSASFSHNRFLSLAGWELINYVEPFLTTQTGAVPESVYEPLLSKLAVLDEEHTVYALEICMLLKPAEFVGHAAAFLSHADASVCCTAYRLIKSLPRTLAPADLAGKIAATPTVDLYAPDVRSGNKVRVGDNTEFIRDLAAGLA